MRSSWPSLPANERAFSRQRSTAASASQVLTPAGLVAARGRARSKTSACLCPASADYGLSMFDLGRTFLAAVERSPDATAITDGERRLGYGSWYEEIARVAGGLTALGLRRGDRLAVILQNRLEMASLHWACQFAGIVVTPLNWRIKPEELDHCLADAGAAAIVFDDVAADTVARAAAAQLVPRIAIGKIDGATCRFKELQGGAEGFTPRAGPEDL